ncbi:MAG: hypothetical protein ACTSU2_02430 [Promethearchaeota archaeon]
MVTISDTLLFKNICEAWHQILDTNLYLNKPEVGLTISDILEFCGYL